MTDTGETISILLSRKNQVGKSNMFRMNFTSQIVVEEGTTINLQSFSCYNSFKNIGPFYQNDYFSVIWIDGQRYDFNITPQGCGIDELGNYIQSVMFSNKLYWIAGTSNGQPNIVYSFEIQENPTLYGCDIVCLYSPSLTDVSASSGTISKPSGSTWSFQSQRVVPQLILAPNLARMLGFYTDNGTIQNQFPPTTNMNTVYNVGSFSAPDMKMNVENITIKTNWLSNALLGDDNDTLALVPVTVSYGDLISYQAGYPRNLWVCPRPYNDLTLSLYDDNGASLADRLYDRDVKFVVDITFKNKLKMK
jgi:hypothetical protein